MGQELDGAEIQRVLARLREFLHQHWEINHATLEPEVAGCERTALLGQWERSPADEPAAPVPSMVDGPAGATLKGEGR